MEKLSSGGDYTYRSPNKTYIEKFSTVDLKTAQAGKSILKASENFYPNKVTKNLKYDHIVTHKQTFGRLNKENSYETVVRLTELPLIDEDENHADIITKQKIIEIENALKNERKLIAENGPTEPEDLFYLQEAEKNMKVLENLFNGRNNLPKKLEKPSPRTLHRTDRKRSSGNLTGTTDRSKVNIKNSAPSWSQDSIKQIKLELLYAAAYSKLPFPATLDDLYDHMLSLRDYDITTEFSSEDLYNLYLQFDRTKQSYVTPEVYEKLNKASTAQEREDILTKFYQEELLPMTSGPSVDIQQVKKELEKRLDVLFLKEPHKASFDSITDNDIRKYIESLYP